MEKICPKLTRHTVFIAGIMAIIGAAGLMGEAAAAPAADAGKDTTKVVKDFIDSWNDPDKAVTYLASDASVRMVEDQPAVVGSSAVAAEFKNFMSHGEKVAVKILTSVAKGPVVMNTRVDTLTTPGKPDQKFKVVGVFIVKDGKIKEWSDYVVK